MAKVKKPLHSCLLLLKNSIWKTPRFHKVLYSRKDQPRISHGNEKKLEFSLNEKT